MSQLLRVRDLEKSFPLKKNLIGRVTSSIQAVEGVTFDLEEHRTLALVGESGAGKSTTGRLINRLLEPSGGQVVFCGKDISHISSGEMRSIRLDMQMIFQDPYSSLDPRQTIIDSVAEPLLVHRGLRRDERHRQSMELLERVGLSSEMAFRRPHELSGGQLQRVSIARALSVNPKLIICDEPVAALDVSIQAQVINLMIDLQVEFGLAYLFISHDLALVRTIADQVAVMRNGTIVEAGPTNVVFSEPEHEYSKELLAAMPGAFE